MPKGEDSYSKIDGIGEEVGSWNPRWAARWVSWDTIFFVRRTDAKVTARSTLGHQAPPY